MLSDLSLLLKEQKNTLIAIRGRTFFALRGIHNRVD